MMILKQVTKIIKICKETGGTSENAAEVLRVVQKVLVQGRDLEIQDPTGPPPLGKTNYILINRNDLIATTFEGIRGIQNLSLSLEVQFYMEACSCITLYIHNIYISPCFLNGRLVMRFSQMKDKNLTLC